MSKDVTYVGELVHCSQVGISTINGKRSPSQPVPDSGTDIPNLPNHRYMRLLMHRRHLLNQKKSLSCDDSETGGPARGEACALRLCRLMRCLVVEVMDPNDIIRSRVAHNKKPGTHHNKKHVEARLEDSRCVSTQGRSSSVHMR